MSALDADEVLTLVEVLVLLLGIALTWAVYYDSDRAELPGEVEIPDPRFPAERYVDDEGRTLT